ncbi:unnamed protein product [Acanthoscelides obtectus]|nr:unnamed protein product [Acanthoscelides obtectus]CAK1658397.1 Sodium/nucleoside cotransporter 2 [Acanthoscelides obtectus]
MNGSTETILSKQEEVDSIDNRVPVNGEKVIDVEKAEEKRELKIWIDKYGSKLISYLVFVVITAYFIWSTCYYLNTEDTNIDVFNSTTCNGYGFLVILYSLYLYGFLYNQLLKPYVLPSLKTAVWQPSVSFLNSIKYGTIIFYISLLIATIAYLAFDTNDNRSRLIPISGLCAFLGLGYIFSSNRSMIPWKTILWGLILQFFFGLLTIRWEVGRNILECIGAKVNILLDYAFEGAAFTYGDFLVHEQAVFAFKALSTIYFISFLVNILYYYGIMQKVIGFLGEVLQWIMGTTICESVNSAANIFLGQSEAPLLLSPYLKDLTDSEIHSVMTSGFATVAGSVMAAYINYGARPQDLITSSIMSAPAALCFSKLMYPETEEVKVKKENIQTVER